MWHLLFCIRLRRRVNKSIGELARMTYAWNSFLKKALMATKLLHDAGMDALELNLCIHSQRLFVLILIANFNYLLLVNYLTALINIFILHGAIQVWIIVWNHRTFVECFWLVHIRLHRIPVIKNAHGQLSLTVVPVARVGSLRIIQLFFALVIDRRLPMALHLVLLTVSFNFTSTRLTWHRFYYLIRIFLLLFFWLRLHVVIGKVRPTLILYHFIQLTNLIILSHFSLLPYRMRSVYYWLIIWLALIVRTAGTVVYLLVDF